MTLKGILYIDDKFEDGLVAIKSDPRIEYISDINFIQKDFRYYDCIVAGMKINENLNESGIIKNAINKGFLPWIIKEECFRLNDIIYGVKVFNSNTVKTFNGVSKSDIKFWKQAISFFEKHNNLETQNSLRNIINILGGLCNESLEILINGYEDNYKI